MSGKIEISRELASDLTRKLVTQEDFERRVAAREELRALLAAPVVEPLVVHLSGPKEWLDSHRAAPVVERQPVACHHEWTDDGEFTLTCTRCGKEENHEPYGWVQTRGDAINDFTQEWDVVQGWEDNGFEYKAMFSHAEQPAPVKVVLPDMQLWSGIAPVDVRNYVKGWNACLDKVKELNQ